MIDPVLRIRAMLSCMEGSVVAPWKARCADLIGRPEATSFGEELWDECIHKFTKTWGSESLIPPIDHAIPSSPVLPRTPSLFAETPPSTPGTNVSVLTRSEDTPCEDAAEGLPFELDTQTPANPGTPWPLIPLDWPTPILLSEDNEWAEVIQRWETDLPQYVLGPAYQGTSRSPSLSRTAPRTQTPDPISPSSPWSHIPCYQQHSSDQTSPRALQHRSTRQPVSISPPVFDPDHPLIPRSSVSSSRSLPISSPCAVLPTVVDPTFPSDLVPWSFAPPPLVTLSIDTALSASPSALFLTLGPHSSSQSPLSPHSSTTSRSCSPSLVHASHLSPLPSHASEPPLSRFRLQARLLGLDQINDALQDSLGMLLNCAISMILPQPHADHNIDHAIEPQHHEIDTHPKDPSRRWTPHPSQQQCGRIDGQPEEEPSTSEPRTPAPSETSGDDDEETNDDESEVDNIVQTAESLRLNEPENIEIHPPEGMATVTIVQEDLATEEARRITEEAEAYLRPINPTTGHRMTADDAAIFRAADQRHQEDQEEASVKDRQEAEDHHTGEGNPNSEEEVEGIPSEEDHHRRRHQQQDQHQEHHTERTNLWENPQAYSMGTEMSTSRSSHNGTSTGGKTQKRRS
ncbi:hypothetical protein EDB92DRAFT_1953103 [Lactarius akahatsu]|uniref:Uncharacterized protein n=1 Tax=Lactarius akahatsu TaxID=416441 RepID=A0AAD4L8J3_9AGAM|nr:hypothetical protein EDB92DRAFT_1953103 [Lactarius akahatsu]